MYHTTPDTPELNPNELPLPVPPQKTILWEIGALIVASILTSLFIWLVAEIAYSYGELNARERANEAARQPTKPPPAILELDPNEGLRFVLPEPVPEWGG